MGLHSEVHSGDIVTIPYFLAIGRTVAYAWRVFDFSKWRLSAILDLFYACLSTTTGSFSHANLSLGVAGHPAGFADTVLQGSRCLRFLDKQEHIGR